MRTRSSATPEWDAADYHRVSDPQFAWGMRVLDRLSLVGDERVLDVGCGSGRLTDELLRRLPRGWLVASDISSNMLREARRTLAPWMPNRCCLTRADAEQFPFRADFDVVFSTATFHWVHDHPRLFRALFEVLRPGGRLHAQCGGGANLASLKGRAAELMRSSEFARYFTAWTDPWQFADEITTVDRLERAGFTEVKTSLEPAPIVFGSAAEYRAFVATVNMRPYFAFLPDQHARARFLTALVDLAAGDDPPFRLDYWRLNLAGLRPAS